MVCWTNFPRQQEENTLDNARTLVCCLSLAHAFPSRTTNVRALFTVRKLQTRNRKFSWTIMVQTGSSVLNFCLYLIFSWIIGSACLGKFFLSFRITILLKRFLYRIAQSWIKTKFIFFKLYLIMNIFSHLNKLLKWVVNLMWVNIICIKYTLQMFAISHKATSAYVNLSNFQKFKCSTLTTFTSTYKLSPAIRASVRSFTHRTTI